MMNAVPRGMMDAGNPHVAPNRQIAVMRGCRSMAFALALAVSCGAAFAGDTSEGLLVYTQTERTSFWRTAPGRTMTLPICFPTGATAANLSVRGSTYSCDYADITTDSFDLTLPEATGESTEDVYELELTFVGNAAVTNTARLACIKGVSNGAAGATRCLTDVTAGKWTRATSHGVMPVPYGATLTVDGAEVQTGDAGFTGAQGWYALPNLAIGAVCPVSLAFGGVTNTVSLAILDHLGFTVIMR